MPQTTLTKEEQRDILSAIHVVLGMLERAEKQDDPHITKKGCVKLHVSLERARDKLFDEWNPDSILRKLRQR